MWDDMDRNDLIGAVNRLAQAQEVANMLSGSVIAMHQNDDTKLATDLFERAMLYVDPPASPRDPA